MGAPQAGQRERGVTTDCRSGKRWMQTLAKLPTIRPAARAVAGHRGVSRASCGKKLASTRHIPLAARILPSCSGGVKDGALSSPRMARPTASLVLLALAVALVFLAFMLAATSGHFVPQVVDLYLVCQYARALAQGHPFHYNPGEPASTGATSLLHTVLLAVPDAVGIRGEGLVAFAILTGVAFYCVSVTLAFRIGRRLAGPREGVLAGLLVALGGPVVWGFLYGSDIALFMCLALWLLTAWLEGWRAAAAGRWIVPATLLSLARPEVLPLALILAVAWLTGP